MTQDESRTRAQSGEGSTYYLQARQRWMVAYTDLDGRRKTKVANPNTEKGAQATLRRLLTARDNGESQGRTLTLAAYTEEWLQARAVAGCRPRTLEAYRERLEKHVLPTLGRVRLDKVTPAAIERLYATLLATPVQGSSPPRTLSARTVAAVHETLRALLRTARKRRLVGHVVTELVDSPRPARYEARTLSIDEARRLLAACREHRHGAMWTFMLGTGCRFGEAAGLTWDNVDLANATAMICQQVTRARDPSKRRPSGRIPVCYVLAPVKTDAGKRQVHLPSFVVAALHRLQQSPIASPLGLVFPNDNGDLLPENKVLHAWHSMLRQARLEGQPNQKPLRMHDLRHSKGTLMADEGEDTTVIQRTLGHASQSITADLYIGRISGALRASADRFGALLEATE